uniref:Uncharacterized protein n=1 Tax=Mesocestoides corti TaxID=53468 RepID=A0A5K3FU40_MESCO
MDTYFRVTLRRLDGLDATWSYLSQVARLSFAERDYPLPLADDEVSKEQTASAESRVDLDDCDESEASGVGGAGGKRKLEDDTPTRRAMKKKKRKKNVASPGKRHLPEASVCAI